MTIDAFRGLPVYCESWGAGPPLLALHAGGSSSAQWQRVAGFLEADHEIVAPDLIGFGRSGVWPDPTGFTHDLQAEYVAELIEEHGDTPMDVIGHSYGGAVAVRLVLSRPDLVRSLVLIEPMLTVLLRDAGDPLFAEYERLAHGFIDLAQAGQDEQAWALFLDYRNGPGAWAGISEKAQARFLAQTKQTAEGFASNLANPTKLDDCRGIALPTTIVCGAETTPPDRRVTELLRDAIPGNRYKSLPGAGHMSPLTHPDDVARVVREHLDWAAARWAA